MRKRNKKIVVAMSGGVDSSVAAALLKKAGFDVIGIFMKLNNFSKESEDRAKKVAKVLKISFKTVNLEKEFRKRIISSFLKEYKKGITPNPCVVCNKEIKFGLLLKKALALDADFIATGHYARLKLSEVEPHSICKLYKGSDKEKDQSYFLWQLNQKQLKRILFPIENYTRAEVEKLAKKFKLPFSGVRKSQEICFIPNKIEDFLKRHIKAKLGPVVEQVHYGVKKIIGRHQGLWFYTIGQRKGIGLSGGPYYVLGKDLKKNILIVTKNEKDLYKKELIAKNVSWVSGEMPKLSLKVRAKIRYRHKSAAATISKIQNTPHQSKLGTGQAKYKILFSSPQRAITPGQSVVFYRDQEVVGGGIIC